MADKAKKALTAATTTALAAIEPMGAINFADFEENAAFKVIESERGTTLEVGQGVRGTYLEDAPYEVTDSESGEVKTIHGYRIQTASGEVVKLAGGYQLNSMFGRIPPGSEVVVLRIENLKLEGKKSMGQYKVAAKV